MPLYTPEPVLRNPARLAREMFADLWAGRGLAWRLMIRNLSAQYRQTVLGYLWAFLPPLFSAGTFIALRHTGILSTGPTPVPYAAWAIIGTFLWQVFVEAITSPMNQVGQARAMLTKINFPREALVLAGVGEVLFNFAVRLIVLIPLLLWFQVPVNAGSLLILPAALAALILLGVTLGVLLIPVSLLYQDIGRAIPLVLPFVMVLSGAVFPIPTTGPARPPATSNHVAPLLETCRDALTGQPLDLLPAALLVTALSLVFLFIGWALYRLAMPHLIERMGG